MPPEDYFENMNWANLITYTRFFLAPLFLLVYFLLPDFLPLIWAVFVLGEITDVLDGWVARRFQLTSELGKVLDPFADVYSRLTLFIAFMMTDLFPLWAFILIFYREISMIFLRLLSMMKGRVVGASKGGKFKAWLYFLVSLLAMLRYTLTRSFGVHEYENLLFWIFTGFLIAAVLVSLLTFLDYVLKFRRS